MKTTTNLLLMTPVTPLHPGVGRAPGAVDLPVQRDPIGYPMVYGSSLKGALRAQCRRRGGIPCNEVFGGEPGEEGKPGKVLVPDLVLFAAPVPSYDHGYIYVTTPYLLRRTLALLEVSIDGGEKACSSDIGGWLKELVEKLLGKTGSLSPGKTVVAGGRKGSGTISIGLMSFDAEHVEPP